ncbi:MAG TPA: glycosyltransferase family 87 protein [Gemmataceae bacterium]|jgi:hypothetical protein|nr:glycosyltransferase family 87 protein [Gemmataceae bacterium]
MPPERVHLNSWDRLALAVWVGLMAAVTCLALVRPRTHSVYPIFAKAGRSWLAGADLYGPPAGSLDQYRYSPVAAVVFVPFGLLPDGLAGVIWRWLGAGVYLGALVWWVRAVLPRRLSGAERGLMFLLIVPLSAGSLHNGQSNVLVLGLLLAGVAGVAVERWWLAGVCVAVACLFKGYPLALGLLLAVAYPRRFAGRWLVALTAGLALPFLCQQPGYVAGQSARWLTSLWTDDDRQSWPAAQTYRDLRLLCRVWLVPLSAQAYLAVQVFMGGAMAALCLAARRVRWPTRRLLTLVLALGCCWMTVLGPATESSTYILLAPSLCWAILEAWGEPRLQWARVVPLMSYGLFVLAQTALWFPRGSEVGKYGPQPMAAVLLLGSVVAVEVHTMTRDKRADGTREPASTSAWAA